jgi:hypothetical protein
VHHPFSRAEALLVAVFKDIDENFTGLCAIIPKSSILYDGR